MKPAIIFPDAMKAVVDVIRQQLTQTSLPVAQSATVGTRVPVTTAAERSSLPYVLVRLDGSALNRQVDEVASIRIAIWHTTEANGLALAQIIRALLLAYPGDNSIRAINPLTGPIPTSDPESGDPLSSFTVAVRLRPSNL